MPTHSETRRFRRDYLALSAAQKEQFRNALGHFIEDMRTAGGFRKGLRVKRVKGTRDVFEMTWAPDGRATFEYGPERVEGEPHVIWRRVGTHDVFNRP